MALADRVLDRRKRVNPAQIVPHGSDTFGHPQDTFSPPEYGDYIATSNDVYATAMLRAKMLSKLPVDVYLGGNEPVTAGPLWSILQTPNPHWTRRRFVMMTELSLAIWGQTYIICEDNREMWWVKPTLLRPIVHATDYISGFLFTPPDGSTPVRFEPDDVIWIQYPNPIDEFASLSPLSAARLAADVARSSMKANRNLFDQGLLGGGIVTPGDREQSFSEEQAADLEKLLARRFRGVDKAHRWAVLRYHLQMSPMNVTPKDAEFIEGMNLSFRHVCRAMGVPPPLVGDAEFATLANLRVYERQLWEHTMEFEARFVEDELNRQLVPRFTNRGRVEFDLSDVVALQEDESEKWTREKDQIQLGALTINEWRTENGLETVEWGDTYWAPANLIPVEGDEPVRSVARYGSAEHELTWRRAIDDRKDDEDTVAGELVDLFGRQEDQVLQQLRQRQRSADDVARNPFNREFWSARFRESILPHLGTAVRRVVGTAGKGVGLSQVQIDEVVTSAEIRKALERQGKRLGDDVNQTTWKRLRKSLSAGLGKGEDIEALSERVRKVYRSATESRARSIAQTEITRATTVGQQHTWTYATQKGVSQVIAKRWVSSLDERVRDTHFWAHGQTVAVADDFRVGACRGPGPGATGCVEEDANCRCFAEPVTREITEDASGWTRVLAELEGP